MNQSDVENRNYELSFTYGSMSYGVENRYFIVNNNEMFELWNKNSDSENYVFLTSMLGKKEEISAVTPKLKSFAMNHHDEMIRDISAKPNADGIQFD